MWYIVGGLAGVLDSAVLFSFFPLWAVLLMTEPLMSCLLMSFLEGDYSSTIQCLPLILREGFFPPHLCAVPYAAAVPPASLWGGCRVCGSVIQRLTVLWDDPCSPALGDSG